ncbi:MAG: uroporphyrinogen decarboxylase family protein [Saccharofermentanales bacterium]
MNGRERVLSVLNHKIPDRVPCYEVLIDPPMVEYILGIQDKNSSMLSPREMVDLYCRLGLDCVIAGLRFFRPTDQIAGGRPDPASLKAPSRDEQEAYLERCARIAEIAHAEGIAAAAYNHGTLDVVYEGMGFENFMYGLYDDYDYVDALTQRLFDYHYQNTELALKTGIDFMLIGDDLAYKSGPFFAPDMFLKLWQERETRMIRLIRDAGFPCEFHSDGKIDFAIPYLIEMGVDLINPIEPDANDIYELKKQWGDKIALRGNVNIGGSLSSGTPDDVYAETRDMVLKLKPGGNYVCSSSHSISKAVIPENYLALVRAVHDYGRYGED